MAYVEVIILKNEKFKRIEEYRFNFTDSKKFTKQDDKISLVNILISIW